MLQFYSCLLNFWEKKLSYLIKITTKSKTSLWLFHSYSYKMPLYSIKITSHPTTYHQRDHHPSITRIIPKRLWSKWDMIRSTNIKYLSFHWPMPPKTPEHFEINYHPIRLMLLWHLINGERVVITTFSHVLNFQFSSHF